MSKQKEAIAQKEELFGKMEVKVSPPDKRGRRRIVYDYSKCVSRLDPTGARETDLNYLFAKHTPDEVSLMLAARNQRTAILNHDFSKELSLDKAKNALAELNSRYKGLPESIQKRFGSVRNFARFIADPRIREGLERLKPKWKPEADAAAKKADAEIAAEAERKDRIAAKRKPVPPAK